MPGFFQRIQQLFTGRAATGTSSESAEIVLRPRDCHCHVIPGVDDGSRDLEESRAMLRLLIDAGARRVIATSHIFPGRFPNEPEQLRPRFDALCAAVADLPVELELGAEHYLDETLHARVLAKRLLAFGPERYVLFECLPGGPVPVDLMAVVYALADGGYTPLLAHVERYAWLRGPDREEIAADLRAAGVRFQVNRTVGAMNRPGHGPRVATLAWVQERGWIDEVGSDLHRATPEGRPYAMT
jgi:tyrosine-protein phosphatase YwqE